MDVLVFLLVESVQKRTNGSRYIFCYKLGHSTQLKQEDSWWLPKISADRFISDRSHPKLWLFQTCMAKATNNPREHNEKNGHFCPPKFNSYFFPRNKPCLLLLTSNSQYQKNIPARFHKYPFFPQTYHPISANMQSPLSLSYTLPLHLGSCMILLDCFHRYPNHHSAIRKILLLQQVFVLFYFFLKTPSP